MNTHTSGSILIAPKTKLFAALFLGCLCLVTAPTAKAQLTFTVDAFTTDTVTITINASTLAGDYTPTAANRLLLADYNNVNNASWINLAGPILGTGSGDVGAVSGSLSFAGNNPFARIGFGTDTDLVSGSSVVTPFSYTVSSTGLFTPGSVTTWGLYWGSPTTDGILQSIGLASAGSTSTAVPEPSTYAVLLGLATLVGTVLRRRSNRGTANPQHSLN